MRQDYHAARLTFYHDDGWAERDTFDLFATIHDDGTVSVDVDTMGTTIATADGYASLLEGVQAAVCLICQHNLTPPDDMEEDEMNGWIGNGQLADVSDLYPCSLQ